MSWRCSHLPAVHSTYLIVSSSRPKTGVTDRIANVGLNSGKCWALCPQTSKGLKHIFNSVRLKSMGCANEVKPVLTCFPKQERRRSSGIKPNSTDEVLKRAEKTTRSRRHLKPGCSTKRVNSPQKQLVRGLIRRLQRYFSVIQSDISGKRWDSETHYAVYQTASRW